MDKIIRVLFVLFVCGMFFLLTIAFMSNGNKVRFGCGFAYDKEHDYIDSKCVPSLFYPMLNKQANRFDIPPHIIDYQYDKRYIVIKQKPQVPLKQIYYDFNDIDYPTGLNNNYYWIIIKKKGEVIGPLSCLEFDSLTDVYNLPVLE